MLRYLNPGGYNFGPKNFDGYGISYIVFGITYSSFFYSACIFLWTSRNHPIVRKRNIPLLLLSLLTLHVYVIIVLIIYVLNGAFPCQVEFWCMSLYLPIGIGLFQAQNQQLLIVSQGQGQLLILEEPFRRLPYKRQGLGTSGYWFRRLKLWWVGINKAGHYQAYVLVGIVVQVRSTGLIICMVCLLPCSSWFRSLFTTYHENSTTTDLSRRMKDLRYVGEAGNGMDAPNPHSLDLTLIDSGRPRSSGSFSGTTSSVHTFSGRFV